MARGGSGAASCRCRISREPLAFASAFYIEAMSGGRRSYSRLPTRKASSRTLPAATARGEGFDYVKATKHEGGTDTLDVLAVDYRFEELGDWI